MNTNAMIFVFGSNLGGRHGAGAAAFARLHRGAVWGQSEGPMGQCYAIPTKDRQIRHTLALGDIKRYVDRFIQYAIENSHLNFQVTCIGCGLAGLKHEDMANLFHAAPFNCYFDLKWQHWLGNMTDTGEKRQYWGEG